MPSPFENLHSDISKRLDDISKLIGVPSKITFIARSPLISGGGMVITEDKIDNAIAELQRYRIDVKPPVPAAVPNEDADKLSDALGKLLACFSIPAAPDVHQVNFTKPAEEIEIIWLRATTVLTDYALAKGKAADGVQK